MHDARDANKRTFLIFRFWLCSHESSLPRKEKIISRALARGDSRSLSDIWISVSLPRSFKGASRGIDPPFLRRRIAGKLPHHGVEGRGEQEAEQRHAEHSEEHGGAERLAHFSASAGRDRERNHAQDESQRGHQDRPLSVPEISANVS